MSRLRRALPPLASLLPFEAAARHESFTRAAAELHLTQAAVSRQIRALETDLGVSLFVRGHRAVALTDAGWRLARAVSGGLESIATAAERLRAARASDDIVLLAEIHVAMHWLIPRLPAFHAEYPEIRLRVNASTQPLAHTDAVFDIALQSTARPAGVFQAMFSVPDAVFPVCSPTVAGQGTLTAADLGDYPLLHCRDDPQDGWLSWDDWLAAVGAGVSAPAGATFDNYSVVLQAAVLGQGIGLGWQRGLTHLLATGQLVRPLRQRLDLPTGLSVYVADPQAVETRRRTVLAWLQSQMQG
ncbi:LysR family transcriptional regulator [Salinisphaera sp. T31B1]|uniref:LysR family transcriptional regulator n=1 Tax=Salinisphaera sp. T31B1 TaxID=727963 RepID=UPI00333F8993